MKRRRNPGVIFTGRVGSKAKPRLRRPSRVIAKEPVKCVDGPLQGHSLYLAKYGDLATLNFTVRGQTGHYAAGEWKPTL